MGYLDKLGKFYNFEVSNERFSRFENRANGMVLKHFRNAFIVGFFIEMIVVNTSCYENIIRKSTIRRLGNWLISEAKQLEDQKLKERRELKQ